MGEVERSSLKWWIDKVVNDPELLPRTEVRGGKAVLVTFCNIFLHRVFRGMEYDKLDGMLANEIHAYCSKNWIAPYGTKEDQGKAVMLAASLGDLAVAACKGDPHGHVAIVYPEGPMIYSGKWQGYTPRLANVGKRNGILGAAYCFIEQPDYFILGKTVA